MYAFQNEPVRVESAISSVHDIEIIIIEIWRN